MTLAPLLWLHCSTGQMSLEIHHRNVVEMMSLAEQEGPASGLEVLGY